VTESAPYWSSGVSVVSDGKVYIRGYDLESLIGQLPFTAAIYLLIKGELPTPAQVRVLDAVLSAVLDFALEKPGTVAARYAVSANPSMAAGLAAGCLSVGSHTLGTEDTAAFIESSFAEFQESDLSMSDFADAKVAQLRREGRRIPGLGHPIFKRVDPRGQLLKQVAMEEGCWPASAELYEAIHASFASLPGKTDIPINDVGIMAATMLGLGFTPAEGTGLAILSTMPGLIAHISEELAAQHPIRIIPPDHVDYTVPRGRDFDGDSAAVGLGSARRSVAGSASGEQ
jgi:citryl-CoA lyase